jgi:hypothetical protein
VLKALLKIDLMSYEIRIGYQAAMKTHLPVLMLALSLSTSAVKAKNPREATMNLGSPDFSDGENIPERFTCDGKDMIENRWSICGR